MDAGTAITTVTNAVYRRVAGPPCSIPVPVPLDYLDPEWRLVDVLCAADHRICGHIAQRRSDGACFLVSTTARRQRRATDPLRRDFAEGHPVQLMLTGGPPRYWLLRTAAHGHKASALIAAPSEAAARALYLTLDGAPPTEVYEQPALPAGVLAYEQEDWDDRD